MKYKYSVLALFFSLHLSVYSQSELATYGFKGKVRIVYSKIYQDPKLDASGKPIIANQQPFIERKLYFDTRGNIDSVVEVLSEGRYFEKYITYHSHIGKKLKSTIKYRYYTNEVIEEMSYNWSDRNMKCSYKGIGISNFTTGHRIFTYNYRESKGEYIQETKKGTLTLKESYKNEFDTYWNLVKTTYTNAQKGNYSILYYYDQMDSMGNYKQVSLIYEDTKKMQRYIEREFLYFDDI